MALQFLSSRWRFKLQLLEFHVNAGLAIVVLVSIGFCLRLLVLLYLLITVIFVFVMYVFLSGCVTRFGADLFSGLSGSVLA